MQTQRVVRSRAAGGAIGGLKTARPRPGGAQVGIACLNNLSPASRPDCQDDSTASTFVSLPRLINDQNLGSQRHLWLFIVPSAFLSPRHPRCNVPRPRLCLSVGTATGKHADTRRYKALAGIRSRAIACCRVALTSGVRGACQCPSMQWVVHTDKASEQSLSVPPSVDAIAVPSARLRFTLRWILLSCPARYCESLDLPRSISITSI